MWSSSITSRRKARKRPLATVGLKKKSSSLRDDCNDGELPPRMPLMPKRRSAHHGERNNGNYNFRKNSSERSEFILQVLSLLLNSVSWKRHWAMTNQQRKRIVNCGGVRVLHGIVVVLIVVLLVLSRRLQLVGFQKDDPRPVLIRSFDFSRVETAGGWLYPTKYIKFVPLSALDPILVEEEIEPPDYGRIKYRSIQDSDTFWRQIVPNDAKKYEEERSRQLKYMNQFRLEHRAYLDDEVDQMLCRRPSWRSNYFPNCNVFHEVDMTRDLNAEWLRTPNLESYLFSHGYYRDAFLLTSYELDGESSVLKTLRFKHDFIGKNYLMVQRDAVVMERLTSSERVMDIYGHCGSSTIVEELAYELEDLVVPRGYMKQEELEDEEEVNPQNDLTPEEKLEIAVAMVESLSELHGFAGGPIVHDDVQLCQWLQTREGTLKLGDFNRATIMSYNDRKEEYCPFNNGLGFGNYRSPEEFDGRDLNEKIDVWSMGNNLYGLVTGLWPFYDYDDDAYIQKQLVQGETGYIDPRYIESSFEEAILVKAVERCWKYEPADRIDIFTLTKLLREGLKQSRLLNARLEAEQGSSSSSLQEEDEDPDIERKHPGDGKSIGFAFSKD